MIILISLFTSVTNYEGPGSKSKQFANSLFLLVFFSRYVREILEIQSSSNGDINLILSS